MFIRSWIRSGAMACGIAVMGVLLAPVHSSGDAASGPQAATGNVTVVAKTSPIAARDREAMKTAVSAFVWGLSNRAPAAVRYFAAEGERTEFGTKDAAYAYFVRTHAPLAYATQMTFDGIRVENGAPVARIYVTDQQGRQWQASFLLARAGLGEWKIVDCRIDPAPGELV